MSNANNCVTEDRYLYGQPYLQPGTSLQHHPRNADFQRVPGAEFLVYPRHRTHHHIGSSSNLIEIEGKEIDFSKNFKK